MNATTPTGAPLNVSIPTLACNVLDPAVASCFDNQAL